MSAHNDDQSRVADLLQEGSGVTTASTAGESSRQHTPGPWQDINGYVYAPWSEIAPFTDVDGVRYDDYRNGLIALVYSTLRYDEAGKILDAGSTIANAAFIVRACNSHHELLAALKTARRVLEVACGTDAPYIREAFKAIDPAIAKAEGVTHG